MNEWISVEEQLPEENTVVLCFEPRKYNVFTSFFIDREQRFQAEWYDRSPTIDGNPGGFGLHPFITHWMPLPLPPEDIS